MTSPRTTTLPGAVTREQLQDDLRRHLARPRLLVDDVVCSPLEHRISAPTTAGLTRVSVSHSDAAGPGSTDLVVKGLQAARHGLPPQMPPEVRARLDRLIPWRLEADALTGPVPDRMPPGLHAPDVVAVHEQDDDRLTLWLADVDPVDTPWTPADVARAAEGLGRLAARRAGDPPLTDVDFLASYRDEQLGSWAVPRLLDPATWRHPLFRLPEVAALRAELTDLAGRVVAVHAALADLPVLPAHGDATPMNLLRPRSAPTEFVLVDWGTATVAPVGFDVVPLVFGRAESGRAPAEDVPAMLAVAVEAYAAGLAMEGLPVPATEVCRSAVTAAVLRYPCTGVPLPALDGEPVDPSTAATKAAFVRMVLDLERSAA
jgi:hypothetical protein